MFLHTSLWKLGHAWVMISAWMEVGQVYVLAKVPDGAVAVVQVKAAQ